MLKKKAQSTLEYVLVLTAIIAVVVVFAAGWLRTRTQKSLEHVAEEMEEQVLQIDYAGEAGN